MHTYIVAPPPTPNGDLHVGHISGPYFGADVSRRYLTLRGRSVTSALSVDVNQSYVVTTAERLGNDARTLAKTSHSDIIDTLNNAKIDFDTIGFPDAAYNKTVIDWFKAIFASGNLKFRQRTIPYDAKRKRFLFEGYASGACPICLAGTNANICEACGHPNEATDLLGLYPTGGSPDEALQSKSVAEYYLCLEDMRDELWAYLNASIPAVRPALRRLLTEIFAKPLPDFPVTFPSDWGISAPFPNADLLVLNVWAEMVPGHYHWLQQAAGTTSSQDQETEYIQFLGFDNSFFYVLAHLGLALTARRIGIKAILPTAFITNEFYLLNNYKFSTSQGHLVWAKDLLSELDADHLRFFLAWSNPEFNQANFTYCDLEDVIAQKLTKPFAQVCAGLANLPTDVAMEGDYSCALRKRFESAYDVNSFSVRIAAQTIANGISILADMQERGVNTSTMIGYARTLASGMAPICPELAQDLWHYAGGRGELGWADMQPADPAPERDHVEAE